MTRTPRSTRRAANLLNGNRIRSGAANPPSVVDNLRQRARSINRPIHSDEIARMDPVLQHHLRVGPAGNRSKPPV